MVNAVATPCPPANVTARLPELDGLRGLAILLILLGHQFNSHWQVAPDSPLIYLIIALRYTWSGVDLFFVLSGFLIGGILLEQRQAVNYYRVFYRRRIGRIFPLYYLNLLIFCGFLWWGGHQISPWLFQNPLPFWSYATFTQNYTSVYYVAYIGFPAYWMGITWSLAVEEQFYFVMPWIIRKVRERWLPYLLLIVIGLAILLRCLIYSAFTVGNIANYIMTPTRTDGLMLGVLIAWSWRDPVWRQWLEAQRRSILAASLMLGGALALLNIWRQDLATYESPVMVTIGYTWVDLFYASLLLLVLLYQKRRSTAFFRHPIMRWLGQISYCYYLIHIPVIGLCYGWWLHMNPRIANGQEFFVSLGALALSLGLATLSWHWLEQPILRRARAIPYGASIA